jgi:hypothetical protein
MIIYTSTLILFFILLSVMVIYTCNFCLYFVIRSWLFTPAPWLTFCCYVVIDHGDLHQHLDFVFYFVIDHGYLHQHLDFLFVVILLSVMAIYTSTLILFLLLFCYRWWLFTPAPWFSFCLYCVIDHGDLHQHLDLFWFCYRSWLFTPVPWFRFCCYFVIDHDYLHQHIDFLLLSIVGIYISTLISLLLLFSYRWWLFTPAPWFCFYFVIDHGYLHQHLDFPFVVIFLSIMVIYTSTLIFFLLLFCYRSWRFTPAP